MRHTYDCPLRWGDMDSLGHVNNVTYVDYMQEARVDMLAVHPPSGGARDLNEGVLVVRHRVEFVRPLVYREAPVRIELWVTEIKAASFTLAYEIFDERPEGQPPGDTPEGRIVYARASTVLSPFVFASDRPRRLSPDERQALERFLEPAQAPAPTGHDGARS